MWNKIHSYNAVNVIRVPRPLDVSRLGGIIKKQLEECGLTGLVLDRKQKRFYYHGGPANIGIKVIKKQTDVQTALNNEIELQLNTPFTEKAFLDLLQRSIREIEGFCNCLVGNVTLN